MQSKTILDRRGIRDDAVEKLKVFLRVRPLTEPEKERGEEQVQFNMCYLNCTVHLQSHCIMR